jgi:hypothetical protein
LKVNAYTDLPAALRSDVDKFKIEFEADFIKLLSYLEARSQSSKSLYADQHKKINRAILAYCAQSYNSHPQEVLYRYCSKLPSSQLSLGVQHLHPIDYKSSESAVSFKNKFKFWIGYKAAEVKLRRHPAFSRFNIIAPRVYLGMMPTVKLAGALLDKFIDESKIDESKNVTPIMKRRRKRSYAVVSTLQKYELFGDGAIHIDHANYFWHNQDVHHFHLPMLDNTVEFDSRNEDEIVKQLIELNDIYK